MLAGHSHMAWGFSSCGSAPPNLGHSEPWQSWSLSAKYLPQHVQNIPRKANSWQPPTQNVSVGLRGLNF